MTGSIIESNKGVLMEYFKGIASGDYYDGNDHQLYLDLDDNIISENTEASENSWLQRDDGSLVKIHSTQGYCDLPDDELYNEAESSIYDFGYSEFLEEIETIIENLEVE